MKISLFVFSALALLSAIILTFSGCAPAFSPETLSRVDRDIKFRDLQANAERYQGKWALLGGVIVEIRNSQKGTLIEVLQTPIDRQGRPRETDESEGRFIIESPQFLDSTVYQKGKHITVAGEVTGHKVQPIGEMQYRFPVLAAGEIKLWEPRTRPQFSFGLGVFRSF